MRGDERGGLSSLVFGRKLSGRCRKTLDLSDVGDDSIMFAGKVNLIREEEGYDSGEYGKGEGDEASGVDMDRVKFHFIPSSPTRLYCL